MNNILSRFWFIYFFIVVVHCFDNNYNNIRSNENIETVQTTTTTTTTTTNEASLELKRKTIMLSPFLPAPPDDLEIIDDHHDDDNDNDDGVDDGDDDDDDDVVDASDYFTNKDWEILIFTQRWPVTGCIEWMSKNEKHRCILPSPREIWTIHGIWPNSMSGMGPFYCNKTATFNIDELQPLMSQLQQFWMNIEKGTSKTSLWEHEWLKHGTCAAEIRSMSKENKYFGQGLSWLQLYSMSWILQEAGISPDQNELSLLQIHKGLLTQLQANPSIHCINNSKNNSTYLSEIRICFNKTLDLIDCDGISQNYNLQKIPIIYKLPFNDDLDDHNNDHDHDNNNNNNRIANSKNILRSNIITNCNLHRTIIYPSVVPSQLYKKLDNKPKHWHFPFVNFYKLIQFITWFTL